MAVLRTIKTALELPIDLALFVVGLLVLWTAFGENPVKVLHALRQEEREEAQWQERWR